jgi:2-polyprenyl-3-methyl-5-hydroxy-6-metoxy-1,4-benzoquinol methylase
VDDAYQQPDVQAVWDRVSQNYDTSVLEGVDNQANLKVMLEFIGNPAGKRICEVGCGSGTTSAKLQSMGALTFLVDLSAKSLTFARKHYQDSGLNAAFSQQNGLRLGFRHGAFDVVWNGVSSSISSTTER